jgi:hypothetical protein
VEDETTKAVDRHRRRHRNVMNDGLKKALQRNSIAP